MVLWSTEELSDIVQCLMSIERDTNSSSNGSISSISSIVDMYVLVLDAAGVTDRQSIMTLQMHLLSCLEKYIASQYPNAQQRCSRLLLRLSALRVVSAKVAEKFLSLSLEGDVKMNALVLEMMN